MIKTPAALKELCNNTSLYAPLCKGFSVKLSERMKKVLDKWQMSDAYPSLLFYQRGRGTFLARVK